MATYRFMVCSKCKNSLLSDNKLWNSPCFGHQGRCPREKGWLQDITVCISLCYRMFIREYPDRSWPVLNKPPTRKIPLCQNYRLSQCLISFEMSLVSLIADWESRTIVYSWNIFRYNCGFFLISYKDSTLFSKDICILVIMYLWNKNRTVLPVISFSLCCLSFVKTQWISVS